MKSKLLYRNKIHILCNYNFLSYKFIYDIVLFFEIHKLKYIAHEEFEVKISNIILAKKVNKSKVYRT